MKKFLAIILATVMMASLVAAMSVSAGGVNLPKYTVDYEHFDKINGDKSPFSFVWYYQGTDPGETLGRGCYTMKYFEDTSMYHGTDANGEKLTAEGFPLFQLRCQMPSILPRLSRYGVYRSLYWNGKVQL